MGMASARVKRKGGGGPAPAPRETACRESPSAARASGAEPRVSTAPRSPSKPTTPVAGVWHEPRLRLPRHSSRSDVERRRASTVRNSNNQQPPRVSSAVAFLVPGDTAPGRPASLSTIRPVVLECLGRPALAPPRGRSSTHRSDRAWRPRPAARHTAGYARAGNGIRFPIAPQCGVLLDFDDRAHPGDCSARGGVSLQRGLRRDADRCAALDARRCSRESPPNTPGPEQPRIIRRGRSPEASPTRNGGSA